MEKRAIIAAMLMAGLLMVYQFLFVQPEPQQPPPRRAESGGARSRGRVRRQLPHQAPSRRASPAASRRSATAPGADGGRRHAACTGRRSAATGERSRPGMLRYRGEKPLVVAGLTGSEGLEVGRAGTPPQPVAFSIEPPAAEAHEGESDGQLTLHGQDGFGLEVTRRALFGGDYTWWSRDQSRESPQRCAERGVILPWRAPVEWPKEMGEKFQGQHPIRTVRLAGGSGDSRGCAQRGGASGGGRLDRARERVVPRGADSPEGRMAPLASAKISQSVPGQAKPGEFVRDRGASDAAGARAGPGVAGKVTIYVGPKEYARLKAVGAGLEKSIYFGGFPLPQSYGGSCRWSGSPSRSWADALVHAYIPQLRCGDHPADRSSRRCCSSRSRSRA